MAFDVYDFRDVNKNVLVTPHIRARLYHMEPGQVDRRHSHDLGHEVFLILEGKAEFMIAGHVEVLEAGQMCVALADEIHQVRNLLPDRRTVMFLSVTPHIQPTHTGRNADGSAHAPQFRANSFYDDVDDTGPIPELLDTFVSGADALADAGVAEVDDPHRPLLPRTVQDVAGAEIPVAQNVGEGEVISVLQKRDEPRGRPPAGVCGQMGIDDLPDAGGRRSKLPALDAARRCPGVHPRFFARMKGGRLGVGNEKSKRGAKGERNETRRGQGEICVRCRGDV